MKHFEVINTFLTLIFSNFQEFCLVHYAGEVTYSVNTFLEKNNDLLFRDIQSLMASSGNTIVASCFKVINDSLPCIQLECFKLEFLLLNY